MVQHDMMLWDHGAPHADGTVSRDQRPEADVNIEFQSASELADDSMRLAFAFSEELELCPPGTTARVEAHLTAVGLPTRVADIPGHTQDRPTLERLMALMAQDKKVQAGQLTFILARDIGDTFVTRDVKTDELQAFLSHQIA